MYGLFEEAPSFEPRGEKVPGGLFAGRAETLVNLSTDGIIAYTNALLNVITWQVCTEKANEDKTRPFNLKIIFSNPFGQ